jgi:hypothetical protein
VPLQAFWNLLFHSVLFLRFSHVDTSRFRFQFAFHSMNTPEFVYLFYWRWAFAFFPLGGDISICMWESFQKWMRWPGHWRVHLQPYHIRTNRFPGFCDCSRWQWACEFNVDHILYYIW